MSHYHSRRQIHYTSRGEGPPVVLIHGMAASLHDWDALVPCLAERRYHACALDLPGHGDSLKPAEARQYQVERLYRHVRDWIDELDLPTPLLLVGHSLGGYLCLDYARRHPERVRGLALINPLYTPGQLSPLVRLLRRRPALGIRAMGLAPAWAIHAALKLDPTHRDHFSPERRRQIAADYKRAAPEILYITRSLPDLTPALPLISHPALVVWGENDLTLRPDSFPRLTQALQNARSAPVPGCGHQPHIGRPELVNHHVLDFFASLPSPP